MFEQTNNQSINQLRMRLITGQTNTWQTDDRQTDRQRYAARAIPPNNTDEIERTFIESSKLVLVRMRLTT